MPKDEYYYFEYFEKNDFLDLIEEMQSLLQNDKQGFRVINVSHSSTYNAKTKRLHYSAIVACVRKP